MRRPSILAVLFSFLALSVLAGCGGGGAVPPVAPGGPTLFEAGRQLTATWTAVAGAASYEVYYSDVEDSSIATLVTGDGNDADTRCIITGLTNGTPYYVWVKAKNSAGTSDFSPGTSGTPISTIFMYAAPLHDGNLGGRTGADAYALANLPSNLAGRTDVHALISVSAGDRIANMPSTFTFPDNIPIVNPDGTQRIGNNWADLLDGSIMCNLRDALNLAETEYYWWSGSNSDGTDYAANCSGWTSNSSLLSGRAGALTNIGSAWLSVYSSPGNTALYVICVAY